MEYGFEETERLHNFFFMTPDLTFQRPVGTDGDLHITHVLPTNFLRNLMFDAYRSLSNKERREWCERFRGLPKICGMIYEVFAIQNGWMFQDDVTCQFLDNTTFTLPGGLQTIRGVLSADTPLQTLWVAPVDYAGLDAVVVTSREGRKCFTFLQMAISKYHGINDVGITQIWAKFDNVDNFEWQFIFVVPSEEIGRRLASNGRSTRHYHREQIPSSPSERSNLRDVPVGYIVFQFPTEEEREEHVEVSFFPVYQRNSFLINPLGIYLEQIRN